MEDGGIGVSHTGVEAGGGGVSIELTTEALGKALFRGPVAFYDYAKGGARQDFECVDEPRFGYAWKRETRSDKGRQYYMVDGKEVASLDEAARLLALPIDPESPAEIYRRHTDEFKFSPKLNYGATRALSEARCNADGGPFGMIRAWLHRSENAWHGGMNAWSDIERKAGREHPSWIYRVKSAAHETSRAMYLFDADRKEDTGLRCALGMKCRDCPILKPIEQSMIDARMRAPFPREVEDFDIDAAKVWVCIGHILSEGSDVIDGAFFRTKRDDDDGWF
jgi:hypothetical protein